MTFKPVEIDNSDIPQPPPPDVTQWEPPRHVYFGPKDARGRMLPEPKNVFVPYPSTRYMKTASGLRTRHVMNADEDAALDPEVWKHSPADFGYVTHPTKEMLRGDDVLEKRPPGRPRKEAA